MNRINNTINSLEHNKKVRITFSKGKYVDSIEKIFTVRETQDSSIQIWDLEGTDFDTIDEIKINQGTIELCYEIYKENSKYKISNPANNDHYKNIKNIRIL